MDFGCVKTRQNFKIHPVRNMSKSLLLLWHFHFMIGLIAETTTDKNHQLLLNYFPERSENCSLLLVDLPPLIPR